MSPDNPGTHPSDLVPGLEVCNLCDAVANGNITCWACVDRWAHSDALRDELVVKLRGRTPERPCGAKEVRDFVAKLEALELARGKPEPIEPMQEWNPIGAGALIVEAGATSSMLSGYLACDRGHLGTACADPGCYLRSGAVFVLGSSDSDAANRFHVPDGTSIELSQDGSKIGGVIEPRRPFKPDHIRVERGDWQRASGMTMCDVCGCDYYSHADVRGYEWLTRLCDGKLVKL